ncbi:proton channel OtopLc-like [Saccostrea cucullata]|uniref:proton channel OtopLc-like n=1 Tax=Saccostrea cuccullata TaxID=36930 RepID=UPI002ED0D176
MSEIDTEEKEPRIQIKHVANPLGTCVSSASEDETEIKPPELKTTTNKISKTRSSSEIKSSNRTDELQRRHSAIGNENVSSESSKKKEDKIKNIPQDNQNLLSKSSDKKYANSNKMRKKSVSSYKDNISENENSENSAPVERPSCYVTNQSNDDILALVDLGPRRSRHNSRKSQDYTPHSSDKTRDENEEGGLLDDEEDQAERKVIADKLRDNISVVGSVMYGILMSVLAVVLPITETFASHGPSQLFEIFYIYMYLFSFIFVVYVHFFILKRRSRFTVLTLTIVRRVRGLLKNNPDKGLTKRRSLTLPSSSPETENVCKRFFHTGSFPLRVGAIVFGVASMIHSGLNLAYFFQLHDGNSVCHHPVQAIKPFMHMTFTFLQLYFIFLHSKLIFTHQKCITRLGLMHLCCTNLAVWFRCIVVETLNAVSRFHREEEEMMSKRNVTEQSALAGADPSAASRKLMNGPESHLILISLPMNNTKNVFLPEISCFWSDLFGEFVQRAGPYLYPCKIEYSLICAAIVYAMWRNVGRKSDEVVLTSSTEQLNSNDPNLRLDCSNSIRGLFAGILVTVGTIITMVAFYVLVTRHPMSSTAIILVHVSETSMFLLMTGAIIFAADRMKNLKFTNVSWRFPVELHLLFVSFTGVFAFAVFGVIAAGFETHKPKGVLNILTNLFMILQSTIQVLFIVAGSKLISANESQERKKRGREFVTFLILCNFALWAMNTFETQQPEHNPVQMDFYGPLAWSVLTHVTVPLSIYFRFHSSVCLINIWRYAWKWHGRQEGQRESAC